MLKKLEQHNITFCLIAEGDLFTRDRLHIVGYFSSLDIQPSPTIQPQSTFL